MARTKGYEPVAPTNPIEEDKESCKDDNERKRFKIGLKKKKKKSEDVEIEPFTTMPVPSNTRYKEENVKRAKPKKSKENGDHEHSADSFDDNATTSTEKRRTNSGQLEQRAQKSNKLRPLDLCIVAIVIMAVGGLVVFFAIRQRHQLIILRPFMPDIPITYSPIPSSYPTSVPSISLQPSIFPTLSTQPTIKDLRENYILEKINVASPKSALPTNPHFIKLNNKTLPQNYAAEWILYMDPLEINENYYDDEIVQRFALATIFFATNATRTEDSKWMSNASICEWEGVVCDKYRNITQLSMVNFNLRGTIPAEISLLHSITDLFLDHNYLQYIHPSFYSLVNLKTLDLSNNELQGTIPTEIMQLTNLMDLYLSFNDFTGEFIDITENDFPQLGELPKLAE